MHGLVLDQTVLEHERLHAVGDAASWGVGGPLQEEDIVREGGLAGPLRVGKRLDQEVKEDADVVLAAGGAIRGDDTGRLSIILQNGIQVFGPQGLPVMREDLLGSALGEIS